jgi:hypothetical protein
MPLYFRLLEREEAMDIKDALAKKEQQLEEAEAAAVRLSDEVTTLRKALAILARDVASPPTAAGGSSAAITTASSVRAATTRSLINTIREIVPRLDEPFSTGAVRAKLQQLDPEWFATIHYSSLSGTMRRMAEAGELEVAEKGGPGKEATYRFNDEMPRPQDAADEQKTIEGER